MEPLPRQFYCRNTVAVARDLLGKLLIRDFDGKELVGGIVETEAYGAQNDPASHAYRKRTDRNAVMFGEQGHAYVYFTYGNHFCLNATARDSLLAGAVLIRAMEPIEGVEIMMRNRKTSVLANIASGPGKLTQAMKITREQNSADLCTKGELYIAEADGKINCRIGRSSRIGIVRALDKKWRFFIKENQHVSRKLTGK
ncbi:MAG: DNA-3-methyladenine glycosylase [Thaumarchaeota archaeon]|nr:DNA-3-methyladenine glycosylase [Nitrososphaerota archaeon]